MPSAISTLAPTPSLWYKASTTAWGEGLPLQQQVVPILVNPSSEECICIQIHRLRPEQDADIPLPRYMSEQAAGMDLCAAVAGELFLEQGRWA